MVRMESFAGHLPNEKANTRDSGAATGESAKAFRLKRVLPDLGGEEVDIMMILE